MGSVNTMDPYKDWITTFLFYFGSPLFNAVPGAYLTREVIAPVPVYPVSPVVARSVLIPFGIPVATGNSDGSEGDGYAWKYGWLRASSAVILLDGSNMKSLASKSSASTWLRRAGNRSDRGTIGF